MVKNSPPNVGGTGSIPGWETKIPHALLPKSQDLKQKQCCNKFNKDLKKKKARIKKIFQKKDKYDKYEKSVVFSVILPRVVANKTFSLATNPNGTI